MSDSLIVIPDISGFTDFVNATEINHSQHIISELLEILIRSQDMGMEVAEVEGDAILFYKENEVPPVRKIIDQGETMFLQFHRHLKEYERNRICNCGACSTAVNLSLKTVVHKSEIGFTEVNNKKKPFGPGIVLAHRLLKNDIPLSGYILFSQSWNDELTEYKETISSGAGFVTAKNNYAKFGQISFQYRDLSFLLPKVMEVDPVYPSTLSKNPLVYQGVIKRPVELVYEAIINLDYRHEWNTAVKDIIYEKNRLNRVGTKHVCVFSGSKAEFETISGDFHSSKFVYGEKLEKAPFNKKIEIYFILDEIEKEKTDIRVEVHFEPLPVIGNLVLPFLKKYQKSVVKKNFKALKLFCEQKLAYTGRDSFNGTSN